jgi:tetratricopeptide (TPR) repeat protein
MKTSITKSALSICVGFLISMQLFGQNLIEQGHALYKAQNYPASLEVFKKAVVTFPDSTRAFSGKADAELSLNDFTDAISDYTKAIQMSPKNANLYVGRSLSEEMTNDTIYRRKALKDLDIAAKLDSTDPGIYINRGDIKRALNDTSGAFSDFNIAIKLNPKSATPYLDKGAMELMISYDRAIKDFDISIKLDSTRADAYINRGFAEAWRGYKNSNTKDYALSMHDFNQALILEPGAGVIYADRAGLEEKMHDTLAAFRDYSTTISLSPNFSRAYFHRGKIKAEINNLSGALDDYNKAIELKPDDAEVYYEKGLVEIKLKDKQKACTDFNAAKQLGNKDAEDAIGKYCR